VGERRITVKGNDTASGEGGVSRVPRGHRGGDDVGSAADAVTGAAGRAARRVDDKFHDAVRKAE